MKLVLHYIVSPVMMDHVYPYHLYVIQELTVMMVLMKLAAPTETVLTLSGAVVMRPALMLTNSVTSFRTVVMAVMKASVKDVGRMSPSSAMMGAASHESVNVMEQLTVMGYYRKMSQLLVSVAVNHHVRTGDFWDMKKMAITSSAPKD